MTPHTPAPDDPTPTSDVASPSDVAGACTGTGASAGLVDFTIDLTAQETLRRAHVIQALGPHWNPLDTLLAEEAAHNLLYTGLDPHQQHLYNTLVTAGVLPARKDGHAAP
ncbi:DUF6400 family protein [Streptomyces erythrochromogenes]|uniref:DUF6400 family protein n=1 Tax=Streptomyces erythrochromogenes TaxID=285574 RepID=UPI003323266B